MKVWVAHWQQWDDAEVVAVYATKEAFEAVKSKAMEDRLSRNYWKNVEAQEFEVQS